MYFFFFFLHILVFFRRWKSENLCVFFLQVKITECLWAKLWTIKSCPTSMKICRSFLQTILKPETKIWKCFSKHVQFLKLYLRHCDRNFDRSAKYSTKNIILFHIPTKKIWSKISPWHSRKLKSKTMYPPPSPTNNNCVFCFLLRGAGHAIYIWSAPIIFWVVQLMSSGSG